MKRHLSFYVLAAAILIVGAVSFDGPASSLWILGVVVLCPLMMIFMVGGMHGGDGDGVRSGGDLTQDPDRKSRRAH